MPPEAVRPERPQDLTLKLHPHFVELSFSLPLENVRGEALKGLKAILLEKRRYRPSDPALGWTKVLKLPFKGDLASERRFFWRDRELRPGFCYRYRVAVLKGFRSQSDWSEAQSFCWTVPPKPPEDFQVKVLVPHQVFLYWKPVTRNLWGEPLPVAPLYRLWRRSLKGETSFPPIADTSFYDETVIPGESYCYAVEALLPYYGTLVPSFKTPEFCVKP